MANYVYRRICSLNFGGIYEETGVSIVKLTPVVVSCSPDDYFSSSAAIWRAQSRPLGFLPPAVA